MSAIDSRGEQCSTPKAVLPPNKVMWSTGHSNLRKSLINQLKVSQKKQPKRQNLARSQNRFTSSGGGDASPNLILMGE